LGKFGEVGCISLEKVLFCREEVFDAEGAGECSQQPQLLVINLLGIIG